MSKKIKHKPSFVKRSILKKTIKNYGFVDLFFLYLGHWNILLLSLLVNILRFKYIKGDLKFLKGRLGFKKKKKTQYDIKSNRL